MYNASVYVFLSVFVCAYVSVSVFECVCVYLCPVCKRAGQSWLSKLLHKHSLSAADDLAGCISYPAGHCRGKAGTPSDPFSGID